MFRKLANSVLAASVALSPVGASAEQYMFRYKSPVQNISMTPPPVDEVEYGLGNDIVAYYVAPVGYDFLKKIPVATQDVVEWRRDETQEETPEGIALNETVGVFSGKPAEPDIRSTLFHGYDAAGHRIARAEVHFNVFEPVGVPAVVDYYTHTNTYFYADIPQPEGVTVHTWVPVDGVVYPDGMSMMNSAFQGVPTKAGSTGLAWRGYDYMGREVAFAYGDILVADGPVVEELLADGTTRMDFLDQTRDKSKNESFEIAATVRKSLGPVTYKLVPATTRPAGVTFSSSGGVLGGVFDGYDTSATFRIEARDSFDGTTGLSDPFTLTTLPAVADLSTLANLSGTVGTAYFKQLTASGLIPGAKWEVLEGALPAGVTLDPKTGTISGTPTEVVTRDGLVIGVSGPGMVPDRSDPFSFRIYPEAVEASTKDLHVRIGTPFSTEGVTITKGATAAYKITAGRTLPSDLSVVSDQTGVVSSAAGVSPAESYDFPLLIDNGRSTTVWQMLRAYNPLQVSFQNAEATRHQWFNKSATVADDSVIGKRSFSIADVDGDPLPDWMTFDPRSGRIYGTPDKIETAGVTYGPYVITVRDEQASAPSDPFTVKVNDRAPIEISINDRDVERFVGNGYRIATEKLAYGTPTFKAASLPGNWPSTLKIRSDGVLTGTTTDPVGTVYSGIVLEVSDNDGSSDKSDPFDLTVKEPDGLGGLWGYFSKTVEWTAGQPLADTLPPLRNGFGSIVYAFSQPGEVAVTDAATGTFSGIPSAAGIYSMPFTVDDETDREPASGTLTLKINEKPDIDAESSYALNRASYVSRQIPITGGTAPLTQSLEGSLPEGLFFSGGRIYGTPKAEGSFPVTLSVKDKAGATATASFTIDVGAPLPIDLSYNSAPFSYGTWGIKHPSIRNAQGAVTFEDVSGTLPPGISFNKSSGGYFSGTPTQTGRFPGITVKAQDSEGRGDTETIEIVVTRAGEVDFNDQTIRHRRGTAFTDFLKPGNVIDPVEFFSADPAGMPFGLVLNQTTGTVSGQFTEEGSYPAAVMVRDAFNRERTATVTFEIIGDLAVSAQDTSAKQYIDTAGAPAATVTNATGAVSFALVEGTLPSGLGIDAATGAVTGTTEESGSFPNLKIEATDADGATARSNAFTVTVDPRDPLVVETPPILSLKQFGTADFTASAKSAIPPVRYKVAPTLPAGLVLDEDLGTISGSTDEVVPETVYTLTAVDSKAGDLGTDVATFSLSVAERDALDVSGEETIEFVQYQDGQAQFSATSAIGAATFTISPALPEGMALDSATGLISGTPEKAMAATAYVLTAVDEKGGERGTKTKNVSIAVKERDSLSLYAPDAFEFTEYVESGFAVIPSSQIGAVSFSVDPALPEGLAIDPFAGTVSGTPVSAAAPAPYTITAVDEKGGDKGTAKWTTQISVKEREALDITGPESHEFVEFQEGKVAFKPVNAIGATSFTISPSLPAGLAIDASTGEISGSPEEAAPAADYQITATDEKGGERGTRTKKVSISVNERIPLTLNGPATIEFARFIDNSASFSTADAIGDVAFSISPALPAGLSIDPATGTISGAPEEQVPATDFTITAVDGKGGVRGTATATVSLVVTERPQLRVELPSVTAKRYQAMSPATPSVVAGTAVGTVGFAISADLPAGMSFDPATGTISGTPTVAVSATPYVLTAVDSKGGSLGTASVPFTLTVADRDPLVIEGPASYQFAQYFEGEAAYSAPAAIGTVDFGIEPALPEGLSLDTATGRISGTSQVKVEDAEYLLTATDDHDSTSRTVKISVGDRLPMTFATPAQQTVMLDHENSIALKVEKAVGPVAWEHASGTLPAGLAFDPSTGVFSGVPTEFGIVPNVVIRATDGFGGSAERTFAFKVIQDGTPITVTAEAAITRAGQEFAAKAPIADNVVGEPVWSIDAGSTGLSIDSATGQIKGRASGVFTSEVTIRVTDPTGRKGEAVVAVSAVPPMSVTAPAGFDVVFNEAPPAEAAAAVTDAVGTVVWSASGRLPNGITIDPATGAFVGKPEELGTFGPIHAVAADTLPGTASSAPITINVKMNDRPIELAVTDFTTKVGHPVATQAPSYSNNVGAVTFFSTDLGGTGLKIDPVTGVLSGTAAAMTDVFVNVSIRDQATARVTSRPLRYRVLPPMQITVPAQVTLTALTEITPVRPTRNYVVGDGVWEPVDESVNKLPEGIVFDTTTGTLKGNAKELGTYGPFTVASSDAVGDRGVSNSFIIKVNPGAFFLGLAKAPQLPDGVKRLQEYSYDFRQHLTNVGMDESELTWSLGANSPPGLTMENGLLSGTPTKSGLFTFDVTTTFGSVSATRSYTMEVKLPETEMMLAEATLPGAKRRASNANNAWTFDFAPLLTLRNIPPESVTFSMEPFGPAEALPKGLTLSAAGVLSGTADSDPGTYAFRITATFQDGPDETVVATTSYSLDLTDEIAFAFNEAVIATANKRLAYSFDLKTLIGDDSVRGLTKDELSWSWAVDPARDPATTMAATPGGLSISGGKISGTPTNSGTYALILTASFDGRTKTKAFVLKSELQEIGMTLPTVTFPAGEVGLAYAPVDLKTGLTLKNVPVSEVRWTMTPSASLLPGEWAGLPKGLSFSAAGVVSGTAENSGTYRFQVDASWENRDAVAEQVLSQKTYTITINPRSYRFTKVEKGGQSFACGLTPDGKVLCWGYNYYGTLGGALGVSGSSNQQSPDLVEPVNLPVGIKDLWVGHNSACAQAANNSVYCWGRSYLGDTGSLDSNNGRAPSVISGLNGVKSMSIGEFNACAISATNDLLCWGSQTDGMVGNGSNTSRAIATPTKIAAFNGIAKQVSVAMESACAVTTGGALYCWGSNEKPLGLNPARTSPVAVPTLVPGMETGVAAVAVGMANACAVMEAGTVKCWGSNSNGALGIGTGTASSLVPMNVIGITGGATDVSVTRVGHDANSLYFPQSCAVVNGGLKCWGTGVQGSSNSSTRSPINITVPGGTVRSLSVAGQGGCLATSGDEGYCWGLNNAYQLGNGTQTPSTPPTRITGR